MRRIFLPPRRISAIIDAYGAVNDDVYSRAGRLAEIPLERGQDRLAARGCAPSSGTAHRAHGAARLSAQRRSRPQTPTVEGLKASEIEGEVLDKEQVRSFNA